MKIVFLGSDLNPLYKTMEAKLAGTLKQHLTTLGKEPVQYKTVSINITCKPVSDPNTVDINGCKTGPMLFRKLVYGVELFYQFLMLLRWKPDLIHFIWVGFTPLTPIMIHIAKRSRAKVVVTILNRHAPPVRYRNADRLIFQSHYSMDLFRKKGIKLPEMSVIRLAVTEVTSPPQEPAIVPYFVFASAPKTVNQIKERGIDLLFAAFRELQRRNSGIQLRFLGRWPEGRTLLEKKMVAYGLSNVILTHDHCPDIAEIIAGSRGVIIPYRHAFIGDVPLSAIEALSLGRPVITTHPIVLEGMKQSPGAILTVAGEPNVLARCLETAAEKTQELQTACQQVASRFSLDSFVQDHYRLYCSVIEHG